MALEDALEDLVHKLKKGKINSKKELQNAKLEAARKHNLDGIPKDSAILKELSPEFRKKMRTLLQKKPMRTYSGVAVVAVMTRPHECPHGKCAYCPGGPEIEVPQSYTGKEPATRRAIQYKFHPYLQTTFRLHQLKSIGHHVDKVELIVMGGTLSAQCIDYQDWFVKECLRAMNQFPENHKRINEIGEERFMQEFLEKEKEFQYREKIQEKNESSEVRCVGLTFEPRPDWAQRGCINRMLEYGVTRVETGVQNPFNFIYCQIERGHTVEDVTKATRQMKDSGLKVSYHMMPGLLGKRMGLDLRGFEKIFNEEEFKPDMLKIYPCLILSGTKYYEKWQKGEFTPLDTEDAVDLIVEVKKKMPPWIRTMRIMRDIPSNLVEAGIKASNLGELVYNQLEKEEKGCSCIRCREVGRFLSQGIEPEVENIELVRRDYLASCGKEIFLSFEDRKKDILIGFLRLRMPSNPFREEITDSSALIRELHVYGPMVEIGEKASYEWQHRGYGKELLQEAERISQEEFGKTKVLVTSGIGARNYYRGFDYQSDGVYMSKSLA